jgi:hypothetical protein
MDLNLKMREHPTLTLAAKVLGLGLVLCQMIATLHVHLSNLDLHEKNLRIMESGYVSVPNAKTLPLLVQWDTAFFGGVFFTLTLGCLLSLFAFFYAWIWRRFFFRKNVYLLPGLILWIATLGLVNSGGLQIMASAYFLLIPPAVFAATLFLMNKDPQPINGKSLTVQVVLFIILAALGFFQLDRGLFIHFRDYVLLSNPVGMKINDFYYRYTLYPAETFKSFDQKLLRTCHLSGMSYGVYEKKLEKVLVRHDCLPVSLEKADISLSAMNHDLVLQFQGKDVLKTDQRAFLANPETYLKAYSQKTDSFAFFRTFVFIALLIGLPIGVYILVFGVLQVLLSVVINRKAASMGASMCCLVAGITLMLLLQEGKTTLEEKDLAGMILSEDRVERTRAIQRVVELKQDIMAYPVGQAHVESPFIPERYWLALALGRSRDPEARGYLARMVEDPQVNVRCKAYVALGESRNKAFIPLIFHKLARSGHVYEQLYAYRALRDLGWKQTR